MKRTRLPFVVAALLASSLSYALDTTQWEFRQTLELTAAGPVRVTLPAETLDAARADRADVRLLAPDGAEVAFNFVRPAPPSPASTRRIPVQARLEDQATVLEFSLPESVAISQLQLVSPAPVFLKGATVALRSATGNWTTVISSALIFRGRNGAEHLAFELGGRSARAVRITIEDERSGPVPFTAVIVEPAGTHASVEVYDEVPVKIVGADHGANDSHLTLDFGLRHRPLAELVMDPADPVFQRPIRLLVQRVVDEQVIEESLTSGTLGRIELPGGRRYSQLVLPAGGTATPSARLELKIENGDSPPLSFGTITARLHRVEIGFVASLTGKYTLLSGAPAAAAPIYDVAAFATDWSALPVTEAAAGAREPNPYFQRTIARVEVPELGGPITAADWKTRREIVLAQSGAQLLELDAAALATCRPDLGDLRVARGNRQVPYIVEQAPRERSLALDPIPAPDPKRPNVGRWRLALPAAGTPLTGLRLTLNEPVFSRIAVVQERVEDNLDKPWTRVLGSLPVERHGATDPTRFTVPLGSRPTTGELFLEIDHGDNAAFAPIRVEGLYLARRIHFQATETAGCVLLTGQAAASAPHYDLQLAAPQLLAAEQNAAVLAPLGTRNVGATSAFDLRGATGRYLFWGALALVVAVLIFLVAKLLPKPPAT